MDRDTIDRLDARLNQLGASLFFHPTTVAAAAGAGIDDVFALYAGRAGVLGDVDAGQAASALAFFDPDVVADVWAGLARFGTPTHVADVFAASMAETAASSWDGAAAAVVTDLGGRVADSVTPTGLALFTGWRARARREREVSRVVHTLRELRCDLHIQCVSVHGLHPLEAEMVTRGEPAAQLHGWRPPYPDPAAFRDRVAAAEDDTSRAMQRVYRAALTEPDLAELVLAVDALAPTDPAAP